MAKVFFGLSSTETVHWFGELLSPLKILIPLFTRALESRKRKDNKLISINRELVLSMIYFYYMEKYYRKCFKKHEEISKSLFYGIGKVRKKFFFKKRALGKKKHFRSSELSRLFLFKPTFRMGIPGDAQRKRIVRGYYIPGYIFNEHLVHGCYTRYFQPPGLEWTV